MAQRIIGGVTVGSTELYEVIENDDRPANPVIVIRSVENPSEQNRILRGTVPNLVNVLKLVGPSSGE